MRKFIPLLFLAFLPAPSCGPQPAPNPPPNPVPTIVPPPHGDAAPPPDACEAQCANEKRLGCPEWREKCVVDCHTADLNLEKIGSAPLNHACVAAASSCDAMRKCR